MRGSCRVGWVPWCRNRIVQLNVVLFLVFSGFCFSAGAEVISGPDLVITSASASASALTGEQVQVNATVKNIGNEINEEGFLVGFYFSEDEILSSDDTFLSNYGYIGGLSAGAEVSMIRSVSVPNGRSDGSYYILAKADYTNGVKDEADENNNTKSSGAIAINILKMSQTSIASNFQGTVELVIGNIGTSGGSVFVEQLIDANQNGVADAGEPVIRSFEVTDGSVVANPNVQGDEDGLADGSITTTLNFFNSLDWYHASGNYVFRVTGDLWQDQKAFVVDPVSRLQTISGTVINGSSSIAGALVQLTDKWNRPVAYAVADSIGQYLLNVEEPGIYRVIPLVFGSVAEKVVTPQVSLNASENVLGVELNPVAGSYRVTGQVKDDITGEGIGGVLVETVSGASYGIAMTEVDGSYDLLLPAGDYTLNIKVDAGASPAFKGYLGNVEGASSVSVAGDIPGVDFSLAEASLLVSGTVLNDSDLGLAGLPVQAMFDGNASSYGALSYAVTDADGNYTLGLSPAENWILSLEGKAAQNRGFIGEIISNFSTTLSPLTGNNLAAHMIDAWVEGTVTDTTSNPIEGVEVTVSDVFGGIGVAIETADDGSYRLGATAGDWSLRAATKAAGYKNVPNETITLIQGVTATIDFVAESGNK